MVGPQTDGRPSLAPLAIRLGSAMLRPFGFMLWTEPPPKRVGVLVAIGAVAVCTLLIYPLKQIAPVVSLGVVYLLAVLLVSAVWGAWLAVCTAVLSAGAFNFFQLPPVR